MINFISEILQIVPGALIALFIRDYIKGKK